MFNKFMFPDKDGAQGADDNQSKGLTTDIKTYEQAQQIFKTPEELIEAAKVDATAELIESIKNGSGLTALKDAGGDIDALFKAVDDFRAKNNLPPPPTPPPPPPDDLKAKAEKLVKDKNISFEQAIKELQPLPPPPPDDKDKIAIEKIAADKGITYEDAKIQFNAQKVMRENEIQKQIDADISVATKPYDQFLTDDNRDIFERQMVAVAQEVVKGGNAPNWTDIAKEVAEALFGPAIANMTGKKLTDLIEISSKISTTDLGNRGAASGDALERLNKNLEQRGLSKSRIQTYGRNDKR